MSFFEAAMILCFGAAWPISIYKSYKSKSIAGKSVAFLFVVDLGYVAGITHKLLYSRDIVTYLYVLNFLMVTADILLYFRNKKRIDKENEGMQATDPI